VKVGPEAGDVARRIFQWAESNDLRIAYGRGSQDGSFQPGLDDESGYLFPFVVYTYGGVEIPFMCLLRFPQAPFDRLEKRKELQTRLTAIDGIAIPDDRLEKRPSFQLTALVGPGALEGPFSRSWSGRSTRLVALGPVALRGRCNGRECVRT